MKYHAVMLDETGVGEFGVDVEAETKEEAQAILNEDYPESRCVQLESPEDTAVREKAQYDHISRGGDYDDEGRPIRGAYYEDDDDEENYAEVDDDYDPDLMDDESLELLEDLVEDDDGQPDELQEWHDYDPNC